MSSPPPGPPPLPPPSQAGPPSPPSSPSPPPSPVFAAAPGPSGAAPSGGRSGSAVVIVALVAVGLVAVIVVGAAAVLLAVRSDEGSSPPVSVVGTAVSPTTQRPDPTVPGTDGVDRPEVPPGFKLVVDDEKGYAFVIPSDWTSSDLTPEALAELVESAGTDDPKLAAALAQAQSAAAQGGLALAYGPPATGGAARVLMLLSFPSGPLTVEQIVAQVSLGLGAVDGRVVSKEPADIAGLDAMRVEVEADAGTGPVTQQQLYLVGDGKAYVLNVSGLDADALRIVQDSLRVTGE